LNLQSSFVDKKNNRFNTVDLDKNEIFGLSYLSEDFHYLIFFIAEPEKNIKELQTLTCQLLYELKNQGKSWGTPKIFDCCRQEISYEDLMEKSESLKRKRSLAKLILWRTEVFF